MHRSVVVLVDNRINYELWPLQLDYFDWYPYGGITRDVELHHLGKTWIDDLRVTTLSIQPPEIQIDINYGSIGASDKTLLEIRLDDETVIEEEIGLTGSDRKISRTLSIPDAALWSPSSPNLHILHVFLGGDDLRERVGLRVVDVIGSQIYLNKVPLTLIGVNRHEFHPQFGHSQPPALLISDLQHLKDLGCNFVRGSHYPQDQRFLDLCDEMGICVWSEAIGWQHTAEHLTDPDFINAQKCHIEEMIRSAANRAAVIMWGLLNESQSHDSRNRPAYITLIDHIRQLDPTRPVTYASCFPYEDLCFDLIDIVSINTYPGWYVGEISEIPDRLEEIFAFLDDNLPSPKPVIISEIGAGAIPGWHDSNKGRWTEEYQAQLLEDVINFLFFKKKRVSGLSVWLFNDFRTKSSVGRPRGYNNKGLLDEYRRPKLAYHHVKRLFSSITTQDFDKPAR
jgi:beta-glucuronidase